MLDLFEVFVNNVVADLQTLAAALPAAVILVHLVPYLADPHKVRQYPGPFLAKFSDVWLGWVCQNGHRSEVVHELHKKYGTFVRLAPNHVSIADPEGLQTVYAHGNGALKSDFYDAFVFKAHGIFSTRERAEHTRKRKIIAHIFSKKSVVEFEPHICLHVGMLIKQWDRLYALARKGMSGSEGEGGWRGEGGRLWLDCLPWANYLAFDIVGDLAFGAPFGMLEKLEDVAMAPRDPERVMKSYGKETSAADVMPIPAAEILNGQGEYSGSIGVLPLWWRPFISRLPWYRRGQDGLLALAGIAILAVAKRLVTPTDRVDLLKKLQEGRDSEGKPLGREELTAEALTFLIAGSDTTSISTSVILFYLARNRSAQAKLHQELDAHLGASDDPVVTEQQVKGLTYLEACINEAHRIHSTSAQGLPRVVPEGGMTVLGRYFPGGTVLSVPSYSIHRDPEVWGEDVEEYRPERWFERDPAAIQKAFNPFSMGPRACVGRNLATFELQIIIASIMKNYDIVLENPNQTLETREGFLRKPLECRIGIKRRSD